MERILLLGGTGILGTEVIRVLQNKKYKWVAPSSKELDIRNRDLVFKYISDFKPSWIINCAAWTNVDAAEDSFEAACEINQHAVENLGTAASFFDCRVIHISTDYVFSGESDEPYIESATPEPINKYGESKLRGEKSLIAVLPDSYVIRTSWLYAATGKNFVTTMVDKSLKHETVSVVDDQVGSPTYARDLGRGILAIIEDTPPPGIYHFSNGGSCSWHELARYIYRIIGSDPELIKAISSSSLGLSAKRPRYSLLNKEKWENVGLPKVITWEQSLRFFLRQHVITNHELEQN
jgi:dTDP-4-dehydrorhamnose reductase